VRATTEREFDTSPLILSPDEAERKSALLDLAWTPSLPARSGFALSLREIRLARSQRARLKGKL
jgi:hypothetical protein